MSLNRRIPRFVIWLVAFMSVFSAAFLLAAPSVSAAGAGPSTPKAYRSVSGDGSANPLDNEFYCKFRNSAEVLCWRSAPTDVNSNDGKENEKAYHFDPKLSSAAGHDVFRPDGNNASDYGFLHFPNSSNGDYAIGQVSTSKVDGSNGVEDNDVDTSSFNVSADKGVCSVEGAKDGKKNTCVVGNTRVTGPGIGATVTSDYKSGYVAYKELANQKCDAGALDFILCPIQSLLTKAVNSMTKIIVENLAVPTGSFFTSTEIKDAFNRVLGIANGAFALIFLVVIFGNTLSLGIDSYTIKKALPRLVIAVLLAQFSYFIAGAIIETGNVLGHAIPQTIFNLDSATIQAFQGGSFSALASILFSIVFLILAFVAVLVGVVVLALRQIILIGLIILGPIAFAAWVLPGTQKGFKFWWENLIKLSLMFPIISTILVGSLFLSRLIGGGDEGSEIVRMGAQLLPIIALLYLPKTFKWSGALMASTGGKISEFGAGQAKKQTVGRAKNALVGDGGAKDKFMSSEAGAKFGGLTGKQRLKSQAGALSRLEKVNAGYANAAKAQLGRSFNAIDATAGLSDDEKDKRKRDAFDSTMKSLGRDTNAKAAVIAQFAKSGNRDIVEHAAKTNVLGGDTGWQSMVSQNYDSFDSVPDLRKSPGVGGADLVTNVGKQLKSMNAEGIVKTNAATQQAMFGYRGERKDAAGNVVQPEIPYDQTMMANLSQTTLKELGDQGVRSRIAPKARLALEAYRNDINSKVAAGTGLTAAEASHKVAFDSWPP